MSTIAHDFSRRRGRAICRESSLFAYLYAARGISQGEPRAFKKSLSGSVTGKKCLVIPHPSSQKACCVFLFFAPLRILICGGKQMRRLLAGENIHSKEHMAGKGRFVRRNASLRARRESRLTRDTLAPSRINCGTAAQTRPT